MTKQTHGTKYSTCLTHLPQCDICVDLRAGNFTDLLKEIYTDLSNYVHNKDVNEVVFFPENFPSLRYKECEFKKSQGLLGKLLTIDRKELLIRDDNVLILSNSNDQYLEKVKEFYAYQRVKFYKQ